MKDNDMKYVTAVIIIGNSDGKISQSEWAHFVADMKYSVESIFNDTEFTGGSDWDAPWQNACFVGLVASQEIERLTQVVKGCRERHNQDSAALIVGDTQFV